MDMGTATNLVSARIALLQAFDSLFPTGAYTLSGGMETYTQKGIVKDKLTLAAFLKAQLYILPYGDLGVCAKTAQGEDFYLMDELCSAMKQPFEIRTGSEKLCLRFLKMQETLFSYPSLSAYYSEILAADSSITADDSATAKNKGQKKMLWPLPYRYWPIHPRFKSRPGYGSGNVLLQPVIAGC
jgi:hypothetical protein